MNKERFSTFFLAASISGSALAGQSPPVDRIAADMAALKSATMITLTESSESRTNKLLIYEPADVSQLLSTVQLKPQTPGTACYGIHVHHAVFKTPSGRVQVSFCRLCSDVLDPVEDRHYQMPEAFYVEIRNQLKKRKLRWEGLKP
jgi:hypothetical protein